MNKNKFFKVILRLMDWLHERQHEIYFIFMSVIIPIAIGFGIYMYIHYLNDPMFIEPSTIPQHLAKPIFIGILTTFLILSFGIFIAHIITMIPFRRLKVFKMEMEFESNLTKQKQIANQFLFSSTMLHNHVENVRYLLENELFELKEVLQFLVESYKNTILEYNDKLKLEIDVVKPNELEEKVEKTLLDSILKQSVPKTNTAYNNRLLGGHNLLIGYIDISGTDKNVMIVRRDFDNPFDTYDQEAFESILGYASILYDVVTMLQVLDDLNRSDD